MTPKPLRVDSASGLKAWAYTGVDGTEWIIRSFTLETAKAAVHVAEKRRTESIAAAMLASETVRPY